MNVLVKWSKNWADEFDTDGFIVTTKEQWEKYIESLTDHDVSCFYFGTNEGWDDLTLKEYLRSCEVVNIDKADVGTLLSLFGCNHASGWNGKEHAKRALIVSYGIFPLVDEKEDILWFKD